MDTSLSPFRQLFQVWTVGCSWRHILSYSWWHKKWQYWHEYDFMSNNNEYFTLFLRTSLPFSALLLSVRFSADTSDILDGRKAQLSYIDRPTNPNFEEEITMPVNFSHLWRSANEILLKYFVPVCRSRFSILEYLAFLIDHLVFLYNSLLSSCSLLIIGSLLLRDTFYWSNLHSNASFSLSATFNAFYCTSFLLP